MLLLPANSISECVWGHFRLHLIHFRRYLCGESSLFSYYTHIHNHTHIYICTIYTHINPLMYQPTRHSTHTRSHTSARMNVFSHWTHLYSQGNKLNLISQCPFACVCVCTHTRVNVFVCISIDHDSINSFLLWPNMAFRHTAQRASPENPRLQLRGSIRT